MRHFYINASKTILRWKSQKKNPAKTEVNVNEMLKLELGQSSDAFKKNSKFMNADDIPYSFSLYYNVKDKSEVRTLDIICKDEKLYSQWVEGLKYLIENKERLLDSFLQEKGKDEEHERHVLYGSLDVYTMGSCSWGQLGHTEDIDELADLDIPTRA